jgi:hypothetical protein
MITLDVLKAARALISDPARWTQGAYARDEQGNEVDIYDAEACAWCALGAITLVSIDMPGSRAWRELMATTAIPVSDFNDNSDHAAVLGLYDRTIARLEREAEDA